VRARETTQGVPLSDDGESEIYTFTYGSPESQYEAPELVSPVDEAVPDISALRFRWYEAEGPRADENEDYRELYQRLILAQKQEGQSPESALDGEPVLEETYSFEEGSLRDKPYPTDATPLTEGTYAWTVQLVGETEEGEEVLASSSAMPFTVEAEETPPPVAGGTIQLTRYASLVGTDNLERQDDTFNGEAQIELDLIGQGDPIRVPAQVTDLVASPDDAGTLTARSGEATSNDPDDPDALASIPGLRLEALRWNDEADAMEAQIRLRPEGPFACEEPSIDPSDDVLTLLSDGTLDGSLSVTPSCPLDVGPFQATPTRTTLHFDQEQGEQTARLEGKAELDISSGVDVTGTLALDLVEGEFQKLDFVIDEPFEWGIPSKDPVLSFQIDRAEVDLNGLTIDGRNQLKLPGGNQLQATFDNLVVSLNQPSIQSGRIVFDEAFALEAGMDESGTNLSYRAVAEETNLSTSPGVLFTLAGTIILDRNGLRSGGTASADLSFGEWSAERTLVADFSNDFAVGLDPFGIRRGQIDLSFEGTSVGYLDAKGYHPDPSQVTAGVPDRLPLPTEQVAYLQLKRNGTPLVTLSQQSDGTTQVETKPGKTLDLVVPALQGDPTLSAEIQNLRVNTRGQVEYKSGIVTASVSGDPLNLTQQDLPLYLQTVEYGRKKSGGTSREGLFLTGTLSLFGEDTGSDGKITLAVDQSGGISGSIDLPDLDERIPVAGDGRAALTIENVSGSINVPASGSASYDLSLGSAFTLRDDGTTHARADLDLRVTQRGLSVEQFSASSDLDTPPLQTDGFGLDVNGISERKSFRYSEQNGFGFRLGLDLQLQLPMPSGRTFVVPLTGVEVFRNAQTGNGGIKLPKQRIHGTTKPALDDQQTLALGPVDLRLFNVNLTEDVTVDWFNLAQSAGQALSALKMDLGVSINAYPPLSDEEFTIKQAGFNNGVFTGQIKAFSFQEGQEATIPLGGSAEIAVSTIRGGLTNDGTPQAPEQGFDIEFSGQFDLPDAFARDGAPSDCGPMDVSVALTTTGALEGTASDFAACGSLAFGPATLTFPSSTLKLAVDSDGEQSAMLDGTANATLEGTGGNTLSATGSAKLDLLTGELLSSSIAFNGAFDYGLPRQDPLFIFRVQQARLSASGLSLTGTGSLRTDDDQEVASVDFDQFTVHPDDGIVSGSVTLDGESGLEFGLQSGTDQPVRVIQPSAPTPQDPALRLTLPASLTLDESGLSVDGSSTASLNFNKETYASLSADFSSLRFGLDPVGVKSGRVDFLTDDQTRVAYYDAGGFNFDAGGIAVATVPKKFPLPNTDIAYLKLRDDQDNVLVDYEPADDGGFELSSTTQNGSAQSIALHLVAVGSGGGHPTFNITIPKSNPITVDDAFQAVKSGRIEVSVDEPLGQQYDLPLRFEKLVFESDQSNNYTLTADGSVDLPDGLGGEQVAFNDLGFANGGVSGTIEGGSYEGAGSVTGGCTDVPSDLSNPLAAAAYTGGSLQSDPSESEINDADLGLRLQGFEFAFDPQSKNEFALVGDVTSRLLKDPTADAVPENIAFTADYAGDTWSANLCTDAISPNPDGDKTVTLQLAELEPDENVGTGIGLEVGPNTVNLILSGTATFPDVLGEDFTATVQDLKMGSDGISVGKAKAATGGQEFTLLNEELKVKTDKPPKGFGVGWDSSAGALELSVSGRLWLPSFMCDGNPGQCEDTDAVSINNFTVNTNGDIGLGSASANLLADRDDPLPVIGESPDPTLGLNEVRLETPQGEAALALTLGGTIRLSDLMEDAPPSEFGATIDSEGQITTDSPLRARFVPEPSSSSDQVDAIGDNTPKKTEVDFGDIATLDVKEAGVRFNGGQISEPAVYANGTLYIQPDDGKVDDLIRFGTLGDKTETTAGLYVDTETAPSFNMEAQISEVDFFGFLALRDIEPTTQETNGASKLVLGGTVEATFEGINGSAGWEQFTISRTDGVETWGQPDGSFSLSLVDIVDLSVDDLEVGTGGFTYERGEADSTITADNYFKLTGATLTLDELGRGAIEEAYYYKQDGDQSLRLYGAEIELKEIATAHASLSYEKRELGDRYEQDKAVKLFASGYATFAEQHVALTGAFENTGGNLRYGLFAKVTSGPIPVGPAVSVTQLGGGFFYRPRGSWVKGIRDGALSSYELIPGEPKTSEDLKFAAYLYGRALLGSGGQGVQAEVLIEGTDQHTSLYGTGYLNNMRDRVQAGLRLSVHYGDRGGVDGGVIVKTQVKPAVTGRADVEFQAFENPNGSGVEWFIGGHAEFAVLGSFTARGNFMASNPGFLLREFTVELNTPDLGIIKVEAGATASFWIVPQEDLGAYAEIFVDASLFGGAAKLGANLKGAYIQQDKLIYVAAEGYVEVVAVYTGRVGLWAAVEEGNVKGGRGSKDRYDDMVADARQQAERMISKAKSAAQQMEDIQEPSVAAGEEELEEAGVNAVHPESDLARSEVHQIFNDLKDAESLVLSDSDLDNLTWAYDHLVDADDKPTPDQANDAYQMAEEKRTDVNARIDEVLSHLEEATTKQTEWANEASETLERLEASSPVSDFQSARYEGSGDNQRMTEAPSWTVDQQQANRQSQDMADLKEDINKLNEQYQQSIAAVEANLEEANELFKKDITFEGKPETTSGESETTLDEVAGLYADAEARTREYYSKRANYLWSLGGWAAAEHATLTSKQSDIVQPFVSAQKSQLNDVLSARHNALKQLAPETCCSIEGGNLPEASSADPSDRFQGAYQTWKKQLWYEIFDLGLPVIEDEAETSAKSLGQQLRSNTGVDAHAEFTEQLDQAYAAKQQLLTTYYGMVEAYRGWRNEMGLEKAVQISGGSVSDDENTLGTEGSSVPDLETSKDVLLGWKLGMTEDLLEPPQINGVSVDRARDKWTATADLTVQASHGNLNLGPAEISYDVNRGTSTDVYSAGPFYTIGDRNEITLHTFAEERDQQTQDFSVAIRARGPGGATLTRRANFTLAVNGDGENTAPDGTVADAIEEDTSPPTQLSLRMPSLSRGTETEYESVSINSLGSGGSFFTESEVQRLWTSSSSALRMEIQAEDRDSDIADFDYKIGTEKGKGDVRDWTSAQGASETFDAGEEGAVTLEAVVRGLSLEEDTPYYVSVRARNGAGLTSVHEHDTAIVYDATPPDAPASADEPFDEGTEPKSRNVVATYDAVTSPPTRKNTSSTPTDPATPSVTVRWEPGSDESGLRDYYEYVVTRGNPDRPFESVTEGQRFPQVFGTSETIRDAQLRYSDIKSDRLTFTDSSWVHVRAVDYAGNSSEPLTIGPVLPTDPSMPTLPKIRPMVVQDGVRLYLIEGAQDPESDISGYQYKIRRANSPQTLKSYPSGAALDIGQGCLDAADLTTLDVSDVDLSEAGSGQRQWRGCAAANLSGSSFAGAGYGQNLGSQDQDDTPDTAPYVLIPHGDLPIGEPLKIDLTPVNGQGFRDQGGRTGDTGPVILGPIRLDDSAPTVSASATGTPNSDVVDVKAQTGDPETGIARVEYLSGYEQWTSVATHQNPPTSSKSYTFEFTPGGLLTAGGGPDTVTVRVTNGAGQQTTKTVRINSGVSDGQTETNWGEGDFEF
jgi:hypothetical protein